MDKFVGWAVISIDESARGRSVCVCVVLDRLMVGRQDGSFNKLTRSCSRALPHMNQPRWTSSRAKPASCFEAGGVSRPLPSAKPQLSATLSRQQQDCALFLSASCHLPLHTSQHRFHQPSFCVIDLPFGLTNARRLNVRL
jgi:hypothetical protein